MAIRGNLRTMQLSELLQWLSMGQKTGTLVVRGKAAEKRIVFQAGRITASSSTLEREYLGHFLVAYGYITDDELTRAMEVQRETKILLGKILVTIGAIAQDALEDLIRLKAAETTYDMFLWKEGAFEFLDGDIPQTPMIPASIDVTAIVMEGLRRYDEWQRILSTVKSTRVIAAVTGLIDPGSLGERERLILVAIDGQRTISEIAVATHNPDFFVAKFLFDMLQSGQAEIVTEQDEPLLEEAQEADPVVFEQATQPPAAAADEFSPRGDSSPGLTPQHDFSRFLRRGPDSSAGTSGRRAARLPASAGVGGTSGTYLFKPTARPEMVRSPEPSPPPAAPRPSAPPAPPAPAPAPPPPSPGDQSSPPNITHTAVPVLKIPMDELMSWSFTPNEAFIVSRINGLWDVKSIVKISPFSEREVLRVFQRLHEGGVIAWR